MPNRSFPQSLYFREFDILESRKHSGCCGSEVAQALILNKIPGFAKSYRDIPIQNIRCRTSVNLLIVNICQKVISLFTQRCSVTHQLTAFNYL
ncbi:MAG TPA: hypothetical protein VKA34_15655 [Balneolales bacterium]|nr:hypothetical protein [Balneolales bacterium]